MISIKERSLSAVAEKNAKLLKDIYDSTETPLWDWREERAKLRYAMAKMWTKLGKQAKESAHRELTTSR